MKTLLLLRHGKSSWAHQVDDHDRPLKGRGRRAARRVGEELRSRGLLPGTVVSSTALRARDTTQLALEAAGLELEPALRRELYFAGLEAALALIAELDDTHDRALLVGHNPGLEELAARLSGEDVVLKTADLVALECDAAAWRELPGRGARLTLTLRARALEA